MPSGQRPFDPREWAGAFDGEPQPLRQNVPSSPMRFAKRLLRPCMYLAAIVLAITLGCQLSRYPSSQDDQMDCLRILGTASNLEAFPLPHSIDERAHTYMLDELHHQEMLAKLLHTRSDVCSKMTTRFGILTEQLAQMTKRFVRSEGEHTIFSMLANIAVLREQLDLVDSDVLSLIHTYLLLGGPYYTLDKAAAKALDLNELKFWREILITWWPVTWKHLGWDERQRHMDLRRDNLSRREEVRAGTVAYEREMQRLIMIRRVFQEVSRTLQSLTALLQEWQIESNGNGVRSWTLSVHKLYAIVANWLPPILREVKVTVRTGESDTMPKRVRKWFGERVVQNGQLRESWRELVHSTDKNEPALAITFKMEWCERPETNTNDTIQDV